jgi:hypothetical protein
MSFDHPDTGQTFILVFNEAIWMGAKMDRTLVNPDQVRANGLTVQDNLFDTFPLYVLSEDGEFNIPMSCQGTTVCTPTCTPTDRELSSCPHVVVLLPHNWDPQNVQFPKAVRTVEEEGSRTVGATSSDFDECARGSDWLAIGTNDSGTNDSTIGDPMVYIIGDLSQRMIASVKVERFVRQASQVEVQDVPQIKTFQSKGQQLSVSPEDLSERCQIGLD